MPLTSRPCSAPDTAELYHYGELSADERHRFAAHLDVCPVCTARLHQLQHLAAVLPDPARVGAADLQRLLHRMAAPRRSLSFLRPLLATAVAAAALALLLLWPPGFDSTSTPQLAERPAEEELLQIFATLEDLGDDEDYRLLAFGTAQ